MVCVICVYGPQTGRTDAEKETFREEMARLAGLSDGQTMLCVAGDFSAHIGMFEPGDEESNEYLDGEQATGRTRTGGNVEEKLDGGSGHVLPEEGEPQNHLQERTAQYRPRPTGGAATAAQVGEGLQSVGGRPHSTNPSSLRSA